jgi:hypothetical protein
VPTNKFTLVANPEDIVDDDNQLDAQTDKNDVMHIYNEVEFENNVTFRNDVFFDNITGDAGIQKHVAWNSGTGLVDITLPGITKTDDTEFTLHAGSGNFLDLSDPNNPTITHVHWDEQTGITDTYATTNLRTAVAVDNTGTVALFADEMTSAQRRDYIMVGLLTHIDGATITQTNLIPQVSVDPIGKMHDICQAIKFVNLEGNVYSGASSSVNSLAVTAGKTFSCDRNYADDKEDPNVTSQEADADIATFFTAYSDGSGGQTVGSASVIDATKYDDGTGTLATLDDGFWVTHRLYRSTTTGSTLLVYGQDVHRGRTEALTKLIVENFDPLPGSSELILRGFLTLKKGAAGLQDTGTSIFTPADKWGEAPANRPTNGFSIGSPSYNSEFFTSRGVGSGTYYLFGNYDAPAADVTLTQASTTQAYGSSNNAYGMRPFAVFAGDGTVDTGQVGLRVTGTTVTDSGTRTTTDTQVITEDITSPALDAYVETTKKFIGAVTYELYVVSGSPTAYSVSFNYGLAKYEDFGNRDFMITDLEIGGLGGANDTAAEIVLLHHKTTGWSYSAAAFIPGNGELTSLNSVYSTEDDITNAEPFFFKLDSTALNQPILGNSGSEGVLIRLVTGQNNTFQFLNAKLAVQF